MKRRNRNIFLLSCILTAITMQSCGSKTENVNKDEITFKQENIVTSSFDGLGVEWGTYEDTNKLAKNAWDRITGAVDRLKPHLVRTMTNFDWFVKNFDDKGTYDLTDDTWEYDFNNKYMNNACDILDYCQEHDIDVAFGVWNVIGNADLSDQWGMIENATSDPRFAKLSVDLMEYLLKIKGYTCIKYFVSTNEPNYTGAVGTSKNAYNTYEKWETGIKQVRKAFDAAGLKNLDIIGGDTTGLVGSAQYLPNIARNLTKAAHNYGVHMYISNYDIDNGQYQKNLNTLYNSIKDLDSSLGKDKHMYIWEAGLLDGKNVVTDCNAYIANFSYGIRMADYTIQSILAGMNGVVYWDLDDAMHFMYLETGMSAKEWGMFSTLNDASSYKQEYRPWYHSSTLLSNLLTRNVKIYKQENEEEMFRTIASIDKDNKNGGIIAINRNKTEITKTFKIEKKIENDENKIYGYIFNESNLRLDENGFVTTNFEINGNLNEKIEMKIPANSVVILSTRRL